MPSVDAEALPADRYELSGSDVRTASADGWEGAAAHHRHLNHHGHAWTDEELESEEVTPCTCLCLWTPSVADVTNCCVTHPDESSYRLRCRLGCRAFALTFTVVGYLGVVVTLFSTLFLTTIGSIAKDGDRHQFALALAVGCALLMGGICAASVGHYADDVLSRMQAPPHSPRPANETTEGVHRNWTSSGRARWRELSAVTHATYAMAHSPAPSSTAPLAKIHEDGESGADEALPSSGPSYCASDRVAVKALSVSFAC